MFKNHVSLSTCHGALHVASLGPLGTHQAIAVAWGVNSGQLGIFFKVSRIQNLIGHQKMHELPHHQVPTLGSLAKPCLWGF